MRIIAGAWRGRKLAAPSGEATRPTSERARQALFDILTHAPFAGRAVILDAVVLDAFAGTGALGLEALSRGAARAYFIERARPALAALRANIATCKAEARSAVFAADALSPPAPPEPAGLVFLDPPYHQGHVPLALATLQGRGWIAAEALVVAEMAADEDLPPVEGFTVADTRAHGAARLHFLRAG